MTFTLYVDGDRWTTHLRSTAAGMPGLVPVAKGNGYGFGLARLAGATEALGTGALAVGLPEEVAQVRCDFSGDVLVLTPYHPATGAAWAALDPDPRVLRTVASLEALDALAGSAARVVVEVRTSMHRHGIEPRDLADAARLAKEVDCAGVALHLPLDGGSHLGEATALLEAAAAAGLPACTAWVSHLRPAEAPALTDRTGIAVRPRVGTALWLGDRSALQARGTVLDVNEVSAGQRVGYRQRRVPRGGHVLVVSGGTAHGVGLEAPRAPVSWSARARALAGGGLGAAGLALSPFTVDGRQRWFAEPPHMQVSMLLLPAGARPPAVGEEVDCAVRMTTTTFDRVVVRSSPDRSTPGRAPRELRLTPPRAAR